MADEADRAQAAVDGHLPLALSKREPELLAVKFCHNCGEAIKPGLLFCDIDCRDDYEARKRAHKNGAGG